MSLYEVAYNLTRESASLLAVSQRIFKPHQTFFQTKYMMLVYSTPELFAQNVTNKGI
jgi:hypothetical protein